MIFNEKHYFCNTLTNERNFCKGKETSHTNSLQLMKRILIAEDNDSNYILMTYILKRSYEFFRAKNGQEAVDMANESDYDLVLMDIKMPIMDGLEATEKIREAHPNLPIIALTANAFDSDRQLAFKAGCNDFLSKPVSSDKCLAMIAKYIGE